MFLLVRDGARNVEARRVVDTTLRVGHCDDLGSLAVEEPCEIRADVPEPLQGYRVLAQAPSLLRRERLDAVEASPRCRFLAAEGTTHREWLPRHDAEDRVPLVHRVRVEDPCHDTAVGADVRSRNVTLGTDVVDDLARVAPRHALELAGREQLRVAHDSALRAAERKTHQRALPRHPHRQRLDLVERDVRVVADTALRRPARDVVRHAVAPIDLDRAVVHRDGNRHLDRLLALREDADQVRIESEDLADPAQLQPRELQRVFAKVRLRHGH